MHHILQMLWPFDYIGMLGHLLSDTIVMCASYLHLFGTLNTNLICLYTRLYFISIQTKSKRNQCQLPFELRWHPFFPCFQGQPRDNFFYLLCALITTAVDKVGERGENVRADACVLAPQKRRTPYAVAPPCLPLLGIAYLFIETKELSWSSL